jgi:hypothetical protein
MALQLKAELQAITWPTGSGNVVFGTDGVYVFAGRPTTAQVPSVIPFVLVGIDSGETDEDHPEFITQGYTLLSAADVAGDPLGEHGIIGGSVADLGDSMGRGVSEVAERVRAAVENLTGADGAKILVSAVSTGSPSPLADGTYIVIDEHTLTALCTSTLHYAAPQLLQLSGELWTWNGPHCSDRFDFLQYRLVEKTGSTASTDPDDGDVVYTGTTANVTFATTSGRTYTVFADYNARGAATVEGSSDPEVGSYRVVA